MVNAPSQNPDDEEQLDALLATYLQQADENPSFDRNHFLNAHPEFADDLGELLEAEALIEKMAGPRLDQLPEGAGAAGFLIIALLVLLIVLIILDITGVADIFTFIK